MDILNLAIAVLISLIVGLSFGLLIKRLITLRNNSVAQTQAEKILDEAQEKQRSIILEAKEESLQSRRETENELKERRSEVRRNERRIARRDENSEKRSINLEKREKRLNERESEIDSIKADLDNLVERQNQQLETVAELSMDEAKDLIMSRAEDDIKHDLAVKYKDFEDTAKSEANDKARMVLGQAMQRLASDVVSESTVSTVEIPSDDMKGRLIGREGRNIRSIEKATGVDLIIDDTPQAITISCFDPVRREIARLALTKLVADGRIHPARIEEMVNKATEEIDEIIWKSGESAVLEADVRGLHPELIKLLGRLKYRYSYGSNVLMHSLETSHLAGMLASEIGANVKTAKLGGPGIN